MHLGADESSEAGRLMPVRMLNEFTYCPRLFYLEWVQGEFIDNEFTVEGRSAHRRVDARPRAFPAPAEETPFEVRSVSLSSAQLGLSAKMLTSAPQSLRARCALPSSQASSRRR
jgi:CRISPR-associated protein Cas1